MNILIHTIPADAHAAAVQVALAEKKVQSHTWFIGDFPSDQTISARLSNTTASRFRVADDVGKNHIDEKFDVVWHRRVGDLQPVSPCVEEIDQMFVQREVRRFVTSAISSIGLDAFWVNGVAESKYADDKMLQLETARRAGFSIPDTLASNCLADIKSFFNESGNRKIIYKPFHAYSWRYSDRQLVSYTRIISISDLSDEHATRACPGIFQAYMEKDFELRVTIMGNYVTAVALYSPDKEDWRMSSQKDELVLKKFSLPTEVESKCLEIMKNLGLVFGCLDLIVKPNGEYVFLEVNEMGQFLWIEFMLPEYRLLDAFTDFLISKDPKFTWNRNKSRFTYQEIAETKKWHDLLSASGFHVSPPHLQLNKTTR